MLKTQYVPQSCGARDSETPRQKHIEMKSFRLQNCEGGVSLPAAIGVLMVNGFDVREPSQTVDL